MFSLYKRLSAFQEVLCSTEKVAWLYFADYIVLVERLIQNQNITPRLSGKEDHTANSYWECSSRSASSI
jgi:hypothetical protein